MELICFHHQASEVPECYFMVKEWCPLLYLLNHITYKGISDLEETRSLHYAELILITAFFICLRKMESGP